MKNNDFVEFKQMQEQKCAFRINNFTQLKKFIFRLLRNYCLGLAQTDDILENNKNI
jgi:hypothetical protein